MSILIKECAPKWNKHDTPVTDTEKHLKVHLMDRESRFRHSFNYSIAQFKMDTNGDPISMGTKPASHRFTQGRIVNWAIFKRCVYYVRTSNYTLEYLAPFIFAVIALILMLGKLLSLLIQSCNSMLENLPNAPLEVFHNNY